MPNVVNIDADIILYAVGFAAGDDPVENALHSVKKMINSICDAAGVEEYECFLTGKNNYRVDIATIKPYKGNRKADKPTHYQAIREYLINVHGAIVVDGMEADDALGIAQTEDSVLASIDKDLDMITGWHYNWRKNDLYYIDEDTATRNFHRQLLTGDSTDNIAGIPGIGPVKANAILDSVAPQEVDFFSDEETDLTITEEEWYWRILEEYSKHYPKPFHAMQETAELIYIQCGDGRWESKW